MNAKSLVAMTGATTVIMFDAPNQKFVAWTPGAPNDGFPIEGGQGYIINVPKTRKFAFIGAPWTDPTEETAAAAPLCHIHGVAAGSVGIRCQWTFGRQTRI